MVGINPLLSESDQCSITGLEVCDNSNPSHVSDVSEGEKYNIGSILYGLALFFAQGVFIGSLFYVHTTNTIKYSDSL